MARMGWIRVERRIVEHWIWTAERFSKGQAWIDLLMMVNFQDCRICLDGKVVTVPRGAVITSQAKLAERWQWNRRSVTKFLELLESDNMIHFRCTQNYTVVTVRNYAAYQDLSAEKVAGFSSTGTKTFPDGCTTQCTTGYTTDCTTQCTTDYTTECTQNKKEKKENKEIIHSVQAAFSEICGSLPQGGASERAIAEAVQRFGLDAIRQAFAKANASAFLTGHNDSGWRADLGWLMRPGNLEKVLSGRFDDRKVDALTEFYRMAREFGNE